MLTVASGLNSQARGRDIRANRFDRDQIRTTVLGAIDAERFDLALVRHTAWTASIGGGIADAEGDEAVPENAGLALDAHDRPVAVIDGQVVARAPLRVGGGGAYGCALRQ